MVVAAGVVFLLYTHTLFLFTRFIEIQFTYHTIYSFKVYNSTNCTFWNCGNIHTTTKFTILSFFSVVFCRIKHIHFGVRPSLPSTSRMLASFQTEALYPSNNSSLLFPPPAPGNPILLPVSVNLTIAGILHK